MHSINGSPANKTIAEAQSTSDARFKAFLNNKDITSKEWLALVDGKKVKCIQHWLGDQDFWFCHWIAESENQIHEKLEAIGADKLFLTMAQEMSVYATSDEPDKKLYS